VKWVSGVLAHDAFVCEVCGRGFATKEMLRKHLYQHDPDKVDERLKEAV
jgi:Zinc finger, C2H2 type